MMRGPYSLDRCSYTVAASSKSGQVEEENDHLKAVLCSVMQENQELRGRIRSSSNSKIYSFINDARDEQPGGVVPSLCRYVAAMLRLMV